jgi:ABC-type Fe3+/spermidine/putrescine transport system ATPase subunit/ABC-type spermidine/putrescine transport system permease subunit II
MSEVLLGSTGRRVLLAYGWLMLALIILPVLVLIPISFSAGSLFVLPPLHYSLEWYRQLLADSDWRDAALTSLTVATIAASLAVCLGVPASIAISRMRGPAAKAMKTLFIAPMIVPLMVMGVGFYIVFVRLRLLGLMVPLALCHAILVIPFVVMPVMARLASLDPALERAASSLGASPFGAIGRVIFPLISHAIAAGFAFAFVFSFDEVVVAQFLSGPRLETLPRLMWDSISMSGLDKTVTAVTTAQLALALLVVSLMSLWKALAAKHLLLARDAEMPGSTTQGHVRSRPKAPETLERQPGVGIDIQRVTKLYAGTPAVDQVSLAIKPGEFVTILGPSGSGKTTLLMLMAGFSSPDAGRLLIGGKDVSHVPPHQRDIGVVFQSYALFPHLNVRRNVGFPLQVRDVRKPQADAAIDWALSRVHMERYAERRIAQLSGGQQQRVALARAIVFRPRALLMDEPLAALDRGLRGQMQQEIRSLQRSLGQTVAYVTHDQEEALNLSDRVAVMRDGRLQQIDTPQELYAHPVNSFVAGFFGEANLFRGVAEGSVLTVNGVLLRLPSTFQGQAVLCVRPEVIDIDAGAGGGTAIEGVVEEARFQGSILRILLRTAIGPVLVTRQIRTLVAAPEPGSALAISWNHEMTHAMAE